MKTPKSRQQDESGVNKRILLQGLRLMKALHKWLLKSSHFDAVEGEKATGACQERRRRKGKIRGLKFFAQMGSKLTRKFRPSAIEYLQQISYSAW